MYSVTIAGMWENTLVSQLWIYLKTKKKMGSMQPPAYSICMSMTASIHLRFLWKRDRMLSAMKALSKSFLYLFPADHPIPISKWRCLKKTINTLRGPYLTSTILDWDLYSPCNTYISLLTRVQSCSILLKAYLAKYYCMYSERSMPKLGRPLFGPG